MCDLVMVLNVQVNTSDATAQQLGEGAPKQVTEEGTRVISPPKLTEQDIEQTLNSMPDAATGQVTPDGKLNF